MQNFVRHRCFRFDRNGKAALHKRITNRMRALRAVVRRRHAPVGDLLYMGMQKLPLRVEEPHAALVRRRSIHQQCWG